jgi:hypothetical protein
MSRKTKKPINKKTEVVDETNIHQLRYFGKIGRENQMELFLELLPSRNIPLTLFIATLRGLEVECSKNIKTAIADGITWGGGVDAWLSFLNERAERASFSPVFGSHDDY